MSWRERLQPGTIGNLTFHTEQAAGSGGRRLVVHEYPLQDVHYVEDIGPSAGSQRLTIFLIGTDYDLARDDLIQLLKSEGPHTLIHPYLGTLRVHINNYEWAITTRQGGYVQFNVDYVLDGKRKFPLSGNANAQQLQSACDNCLEIATNTYTERFSVTSQPAFVQDAALTQMTSALAAMQDLSSQFGSLLDADPLTETFDLFNNDLSSLLGQPATLASQVTSLIASLMGNSSSTTTAVNGYNVLTNSIASTDIIQTTTPARAQQAQNQTATQQLLTTATTVETARLIANESAPFVTYDDAIATRDQLLEQIDGLIENGSDTEYSPLVDLQTALMKRVDDVAPGLQRVDQIQLQQSVPALVLAHTLYGDANKADELISRNNIKNPSFMPAGTDLEVLL
jgi:prophage DNA circulation protein